MALINYNKSKILLIFFFLFLHFVYCHILRLLWCYLFYQSKLTFNRDYRNSIVNVYTLYRLFCGVRHVMCHVMCWRHNVTWCGIHVTRHNTGEPLANNIKVINNENRTLLWFWKYMSVNDQLAWIIAGMRFPNMFHNFIRCIIIHITSYVIGIGIYITRIL